MDHRLQQEWNKLMAENQLRAKDLEQTQVPSEGGGRDSVSSLISWLLLMIQAYCRYYAVAYRNFCGFLFCTLPVSLSEVLFLPEIFFDSFITNIYIAPLHGQYPGALLLIDLRFSYHWLLKFLVQISASEFLIWNFHVVPVTLRFVRCQQRKLKLLMEHEAAETKELDDKCEVELIEWREQLSTKKQVMLPPGGRNVSQTQEYFRCSLKALNMTLA